MELSAELSLQVWFMPTVHFPAAPTQPTPGMKHPVGQLQTLTVWLLVRAQLHAPTEQVLGKSPTLPQQLWDLTSPPVATHSAASDEPASLTPPSALGHSPSDSLEIPALVRWHSLP
jgi:hypothetical protein